MGNGLILIDGNWFHIGIHRNGDCLDITKDLKEILTQKTVYNFKINDNEFKALYLPNQMDNGYLNFSKI